MGIRATVKLVVVVTVQAPADVNGENTPFLRFLSVNMGIKSKATTSNEKNKGALILLVVPFTIR